MICKYNQLKLLNSLIFFLFHDVQMFSAAERSELQDFSTVKLYWLSSWYCLDEISKAFTEKTIWIGVQVAVKPSALTAPFQDVQAVSQALTHPRRFKLLN